VGRSFLAFTFSLILTGQFMVPILAQNTLLPPAKQQFLDNSGRPLSGGTVDFFVPSTSTRKNTFQAASGRYSYRS